jgi:Sec-independent protein translocase protein TatA
VKGFRKGMEDVKEEEKLEPDQLPSDQKKESEEPARSKEHSA